jgi:hypothetical protein
LVRTTKWALIGRSEAAAACFAGSQRGTKPSFSAVSVGFLPESGAPHRGIGFAFQ